MPQKKKESNGCGCLNIPFSVIIAVLGGGYWWFSQKGNLDISKFLPKNERISIPIVTPAPTASKIPITTVSPTPASTLSTPNLPVNNKKSPAEKIQNQKTPLVLTPWEKK